MENITGQVVARVRLGDYSVQHLFQLLSCCSYITSLNRNEKKLPSLRNRKNGETVSKIVETVGLSRKQLRPLLKSTLPHHS